MTELQKSEVRRLYHEGKSKKYICQKLGLTDGQVRHFTSISGLSNRTKYWTKEEVDLLKKRYQSVKYSEEIKLDELATVLGKYKANICRKAKLLGLTDKKRRGKKNRKIKQNMFSTKEELLKYRADCTKRYFKTKGHPRGMKGKKHSEKALEKISEASKKQNASRTQEQKSDIALKAMKTKEKNGTLYMSKKASWKSAWRNIGGQDKYYRSRWEANYARYLQWLKENNQIQEWQHEPKTFWFEKIKRGTRSYLPDFWVKENDGSEAYHEVKGWMDDKSKTKIKRMRKYYPEIKLIVIDTPVYKGILKKMSGIIKDWEFDSKGR